MIKQTKEILQPARLGYLPSLPAGACPSSRGSGKKVFCYYSSTRMSTSTTAGNSASLTVCFERQIYTFLWHIDDAAVAPSYYYELMTTLNTLSNYSPRPDHKTVPYSPPSYLPYPPFQSIGPLADAFYKSICPYICVCVCLFTFWGTV